MQSFTIFEISTLGMWMGAAAVAAVLIASLRLLDRRFPKPDGRSHLDEWHHGYLVMLALPGPAATSAELWIRLVFLAIALDDAWQHAYQALARHPEYRSPLHRTWWALHQLLTRHTRAPRLQPAGAGAAALEGMNGMSHGEAFMLTLTLLVGLTMWALAAGTGR